MSALSRALLCEGRNRAGTDAGLSARATLHGLPFPMDDTPRNGEFSKRLSFACFSLEDAPKEVPLGDKEK
jgi:hypothetical protein